MATYSGHYGVNDTSLEILNTPHSLGVKTGVGEYPVKIQMANMGSGGTHCFWKEITGSEAYQTIDVHLCDSSGNNKVKIGTVSVKNYGVNTTVGANTTFTNTSRLLQNTNIYIIVTGSNNQDSHVAFRGQTDVTITTNTATYTLTVQANPSEGGSVTGGGTKAYNSKTQLSATVNTGYSFSSWTKTSGTLSSTSSTPTTFTMPNSNATVTANLTHVVRNLTGVSNPSSGGTVTLGASTGYYNSKIQISASPTVGYSFANWTTTGGTLASSTASTTTITMPNADATVTANFTHHTYSVSAIASPSTMGSVTLSDTVGHYGDEISLTASPNLGYIFTGWSTTSGSIDNLYSENATLTLENSNATVTASFEQGVGTITVSPSPSDGGIVTGSGTYTPGQTINITAVPNSGYSFLNWEARKGEFGDEYSPSTTYIVPAGIVTVTANFAPSYIRTSVETRDIAWTTESGKITLSCNMINESQMTQSQTCIPATITLCLGVKQ